MKYIIPIILLLIAIPYYNNESNNVDEWVRWNYEGFEKKMAWPEFKEILDTVKDAKGRIANDLHDVNNKFGSVRSFEAIPFFANAANIEGGISSSALSSMFTYYIQCEMSRSCAGFPRIMEPTQHNITAGTKHCHLYNVQYYIAYFPELREELANSSEWELVKNVGTHDIYELVTNDLNYVYIPKFEPILTETKNWKLLALDWYYDLKNIDQPLVFVNKIKDDKLFKLTGDELLVKDFLEKTGAGILVNNSECIINDVFFGDELKFTTTCPGKPHIIKISYYPNWKVEGADSIYLVTPGFMLIFPESENVRLYYGRTGSDIFGISLTILGILMILMLLIWRIYNKK